MGRNSVEGYQGGNWPSTTGNRSGGGRGNAESSEIWDDDNEVNPSYVKQDEQFCWAAVGRAYSEYASESAGSMPPMPLQAHKYEGVITRFEHRGNQVLFRIDTDPRESPFKLAEQLVDYWRGQSLKHFYTHNLIGDRVRFIGSRKPLFDNPWMRVNRFENLDWSEERFDHDPYLFELENRLRLGDLGNKAIIRAPLGEQNKKRWFLMSGNYFCRRVGFEAQEQVTAWMESLKDYIQWREGYKFKINKNWLECSIVDVNGNPP